MAKISSPRAELAALRAACHQDPTVSGTILHTLDESYLYNAESKEILSVIQEHRAETGRAPRYKLLLDDPRLSDEAVQFLRSSEPIVTTRAEAAKVVRALSEYRKRRGLYKIGSYIADQVNAKQPLRSDLVLDNIGSALSRIRAVHSRDVFLHMGRNDNAGKAVHDLLFGDRSQQVIPTGFKTYDEVNGGLFRSSFVTMGGPTGAGKTTLGIQLLVNMVEFGFKVHAVHLEMEKDEMLAKIIACVVGVDSLDIMLGRLTPNDKKLIEQKFLKWRKKVHAKGGRFTLAKPDGDLGVEATIAMLDAYAADVILIDYVGLMAGLDGEDQWRKMMNACRYLKINAGNTQRLIIGLVQVDEDGKVRYSRGMQEHANDSWLFTADEDILNITQKKARNHKAFPFSLRVQRDLCRVHDMPQEGVGGDEATPKSESKRDKLINLAE